MKVLITGGYGFIGSQIVVDLIQHNHKVICCAKNIEFAKKIFPNIQVIYSDFARDISQEIWIPRLKGIDVVINCVGVLNASDAMMWRIHNETPRALFNACLASGVRQIIQISALGVESSHALFAKSKKAADDYLQSLPIQSAVIRPSLVYGSGSFGGTSLFRGLSGLPGFIPVPAKEVQFQPIHIKDLSQSIINLISQEITKKEIIDAVGPERITLYQILSDMRQWLGFGHAVKVLIPNWIIKTVVKLGDWFRFTMNSTLYEMSLKNNVTCQEKTLKFQDLLDYKPRNFQEGLHQQPSYVQDRWHARLYFLRPLLRLSLGFIWLYSGIVSLFGYPHSLSYELLTQMGMYSHQEFILYSASILDICLGILTILGRRISLIGSIQILLISIYTILISVKLPQFWLHPFAPIAKNVPLLVATLIMMAMESKR